MDLLRDIRMESDLRDDSGDGGRERSRLVRDSRAEKDLRDVDVGEFTGDNEDDIENPPPPTRVRKRVPSMLSAMIASLIPRREASRWLGFEAAM